MAIERTLVLSTSHLTEDTNALLTEMSKRCTNFSEQMAMQERHLPIQNINSDEILMSEEEGKYATPVRYVPKLNHHYGYIFFLGDQIPRMEGMPDLELILTYALNEKCTMVNFDRDAEVMPHFKTYDW